MLQVIKEEEEGMATTESPAGRTVIEAAEAMAREIQESFEWRRWEEARAHFDNDPGMIQASRRLRELTREFRMAQAQGKGLVGPDLAEMDRLQSEVQSSPLTRERDASAQALLEYLRDVNRVLSDGLGVDFAATAAPRQGRGCCG